MNKYYIILPIFLITLFLITGCSKKNEQNSNEQKNTEQQTMENQLPKWDENFDEVSLDDLELGQQILVMGSENSDGSISANQIMIGNSEADFENMARPMRPPVNNDENNDSQPAQPPTDFNNGARPNLERFQNMSEEERAKFREEMRGQREANGENFSRPSTRGSGITRLNGELINKDEATITLKIKDGGSKLIFYSDQTKILKFKSN